MAFGFLRHLVDNTIDRYRYARDALSERLSSVTSKFFGESEDEPEFFDEEEISGLSPEDIAAQAEIDNEILYQANDALFGEIDELSQFDDIDEIGDIQYDADLVSEVDFLAIDIDSLSIERDSYERELADALDIDISAFSDLSDSQLLQLDALGEFVEIVNDFDIETRMGELGLSELSFEFAGEFLSLKDLFESIEDSSRSVSILISEADGEYEFLLLEGISL